MSRRVEDIILVSSLYDTFILQEDGQLSELILSEFLELNLHHTTGLTHVSSGEEAIALAKSQNRFNLIITAVNVGDMDAAELARRVRREGLDVPVILLAYDGGELAEFRAHRDTSDIERMFLWQGDPRILLAIVKYVEDRLNVAYDTGVAGVQCILLIEDNIRFYSAFLPLIYVEVIRHSQSLIAEGINMAHKILRMRARPKILLCANFEEAWEYFSSLSEQTLGVISDIQFPREGSLDPEAGVEFARRVREAWPDIPILLQSSRPESERLATEVGADFMLKGSPTLLADLRQFMIDRFAFGDFLFSMPDGTVVDRAHDLRSLLEKLRVVPEESITYHADRNDFSRWLRVRTEFDLAHHLRPRRHTDYAGSEERRQYLVDQIDAYRREQSRETVGDFDRSKFDATSSFSRIGGGSLGGKARALAFARHLLTDFDLVDQYEGVRISVPPSLVLGTDVFDRFIEDNGLRDFAMHSSDDEEIQKRFVEAEFPAGVACDLESFLELIHYPLAVRSSSLLEDSQYQPLAGVYNTYMLPNNHEDRGVRLRQLVTAVKRVYASTFLTYAKNYFKVTPYRLEEEKMAVIIQKVVGSRHGTRFYPHLAGVARSFNCYPFPPQASEDGVVAVALGLGRTVVDGERSQSFCPKYPQHLVHFSTPKDMLANSQREFISIELDSLNDEVTEMHHPLEVAEQDGTLSYVASTYTPENDAVCDGTSRPGIRLVSFAAILKHGLFPLPEILTRLMNLGSWGMNTEVEIEFAVDLTTTRGVPREFGFLQMRPLAMSRELEELEVDDVAPGDVFCRSSSVLGNGKLAHIRDVVAVDHRRFDRAKSHEVALELARLNAELAAEELPYILIGLGRWGSADPWLGIPVTWEQISGARVIVESGLKDIKVTPSQGSHFFQNLTSFRVGYFTVNPETGDGLLDWDWLDSQPAKRESTFARHLRFSGPRRQGLERRGAAA
jgi:CheY-like chemotaxis protein